MGNPKKDAPRKEKLIFADLVELCARPGYPHALAYICLNHTAHRHAKPVTSDDLCTDRDPLHLTPSEVDTLVGCLVKADTKWQTVSADLVREMVTKSLSLMREFELILAHNTTNARNALANNPDFQAPVDSSGGSQELDSVLTGADLRYEPFYAVETASDCQFHDMAADRYVNDVDWMIENRGYTPDDAKAVCTAILDSHAERLVEMKNSARKPKSANLSPNQSVLSRFLLSTTDLSSRSGVGPNRVNAFLAAFTTDASSANDKYMHVDGENCVSAKPIVKTQGGKRYLFHPRALFKSTYDTPFWWMEQDSAYIDTAAKNRGSFPERFLHSSMRAIFGDSAVFTNVDLYMENLQGKITKAAEIDCLVVYGEHALVFQAKSKKHSSTSRDNKSTLLKMSFQIGIQKAYDQAVTCAGAMRVRGMKFACPDGNVPNLKNVRHIHPVCVIADCQPALAVQTRAFLKTSKRKILTAPFVCDLFLIDMLSDILQSPRRFLDYITQRARIGNDILVTDEIAILDFYLTQGNRKTGDPANTGIDGNLFAPSRVLSRNSIADNPFNPYDMKSWKSGRSGKSTSGKQPRKKSYKPRRHSQ